MDGDIIARSPRRPNRTQIRVIREKPGRGIGGWPPKPTPKNHGDEPPGERPDPTLWPPKIKRTVDIKIRKTKAPAFKIK